MMMLPWNVRVREGRNCYCAEVRIKGKWFDAGTGKTWFEAFLMGWWA
jgi:hypothetical protein